MSPTRCTILGAAAVVLTAWSVGALLLAKDRREQAANRRQVVATLTKAGLR
jgi:hypothetical protein